MERSFNIQKLIVIVIYAISFCLPIFPKALPPLIACLILLWLISGGVKQHFFQFLKNKAALFLSAFYFLYLIGLFYSENIEYGLKDIETKFSLVVFPLLFSSLNTKIDLKNVFLSFILGCFAASIACFSIATYLYFNEGVNHFSYTDFSLFLHPSYFSAYLNTSIIILVIWNFNTSPLKIKVLNYLLILIFSITIIFLSSKLGIISLPIPFIIGYYYLFFVKKKRLQTLTHLALLFIIIYFSYSRFIKNTRMGELHTITSIMPFQEIFFCKADSTTTTPINYATTESSQVRYLIWQESTQLIKENWLFGVGTGDIKDKLVEKYKAKKIWWAYEKKLNAHNQYLQTMGAIGIIGLFLLLGSFYIALHNSIKKGNYIYLNFAIVIALNFMVESMLETQAGVIFYAFFNSLLLFLGNKETFSLTAKVNNHENYS